LGASQRLVILRCKTPARRLDLPVVSVPLDELMVPGYFGALASLVTKNYPAATLITRQTLGWEPTQPTLMADLDNGHYFPND